MVQRKPKYRTYPPLSVTTKTASYARPPLTGPVRTSESGTVAVCRGCRAYFEPQEWQRQYWCPNCKKHATCSHGIGLLDSCPDCANKHKSRFIRS